MSTKTKSKSTSKSTKAKSNTKQPASKPSTKTKKLLADAKQSIAKNLQELDAPKSKRVAKGTAQITTDGKSPWSKYRRSR